MILNRYIFRELLISFIGVTLVLLLIFLGGLLIRFLPDVTSGLIPINKFLPIVGISLLEESVAGIPLAFFLALVISMGKLFSDYELIAAYACGFQRSKLMSIVISLAVVSALLVGAASIVLAPLADQRYREILAEIEQQSDINSIVAGKFIGLSNGGLIYTESGDNVDGFENVSIFQSTLDEYLVINAKTLSEGEDSANKKLLIFRDGARTTLSKDSMEVKITSFSEYGVQTKLKEVTPAHSMYALPVSVLWGSNNPYHIAELQWRISTPLMVLVLAVVAVAISRYKPRSGKYGRLFIAIAIYMIYSHLIMSSKVAIVQKTIPPIIGMWWVHLSILLIFPSLFISQERRAG